MGDSLYTAKPRDYFGVVKRDIIAVLDPRPLGRILDVGGGDGATARFLIDDGRATFAQIIDPYSEAEDSPGLRFSRESADDLSVFGKWASEGAVFETVMFLDVLEHLVNPWATLQSVRQVHADGGRLVVCMPNARFVALIVPLVLFGRFDYKSSGIMDRTHIRWFTRATTIELIEGAGYRVDRIDAYVEPRVRLANRLTLGLLRRFFEYQYIIQATKLP